MPSLQRKRFGDMTMAMFLADMRLTDCNEDRAHKRSDRYCCSTRECRTISHGTCLLKDDEADEVEQPHDDALLRLRQALDLTRYLEAVSIQSDLKSHREQQHETGSGDLPAHARRGQ